MRVLPAVVLSMAMLVAAASQAAAAAPPWYPPMGWLPASDENYDVGRAGAPITRIVIHATGGQYAGTLSWFQDPHAHLSAHYVVRAADGEITQMVAEKDTAFHVRGSNRGTIGIEHEFDPSSGIEYTDALYRSSARLVCAIARRYGIPLDRSHVLGHSEVANADHADPGPTWNWTYYMSLLRGCGATAGSAAVSSTTDCDSACVPPPDLRVGDEGPAVMQLQWHLVTLGFMSAATVVAGGAHFGSQTLAAIRAFQEANGIAGTGTYGPLTAAALARSLAPQTSRVARSGLALGMRSADVLQLQRDLSGLGYMSAVTGYFGAVTESAVRRFQSDHGIEVTGTYGPLTRAALLARLR